MGRTVLIEVSSDSFPVLLGLFKVITTDRVVYLESPRESSQSLPLQSAVFVLLIPLQAFEPIAEIICPLCFES